MKKSSNSFSIRSLVAVVAVLGLTYFILDMSGRFYYAPICERYAESRHLTYTSYSPGWAKQSRPAECFFRDRNGNSTRVEVSSLTLTSEDWVRWVVSWAMTILGVGGSVWLASVISGHKRRRRR